MAAGHSPRSRMIAAGPVLPNPTAAADHDLPGPTAAAGPALPDPTVAADPALPDPAVAADPALPDPTAAAGRTLPNRTTATAPVPRPLTAAIALAVLFPAAVSAGRRRTAAMTAPDAIPLPTPARQSAVRPPESLPPSSPALRETILTDTAAHSSAGRKTESEDAYPGMPPHVSGQTAAGEGGEAGCSR